MERSGIDRPTADEALATLLEGNKRFISGDLEHPNHSLESLKAVAFTQEPLATVLTCSDSRVPPVDIFDQGIGDIFVIRVAGNVFNDHVIGSIEYAVEILHTPLVMVMGHSRCGAITAVASEQRLNGHMATFTPPIQTAIKKAHGQKGNLIDNTAKSLALMLAEQIAHSEPILAHHVTTGKIKIIPTYFDLSTGEVHLLNAPLW